MTGLSRTGSPRPVTTVHIGLGAFHRAHQAWYTQPTEHGIAAFTGRRPDAAAVLSTQDCVYTLLVRGPEDDTAEVVESISAAHDGADLAALRGYLADPAVTVVTLTVTEAGYRPSAGDVERLRAGADPVGAVGRLVAGLRARRAADAGPLAVVPCDNLASNGATTRRAVTELAAAVDPALASWVEASVAFVPTMVDRITPATTDADRAAVAALTGRTDRAPVVTEPFTEWVLGEEFPAARPGWEKAGARFVADVEPFELRKLWLLNGAHSLLAYAAPARGHTLVAEAVEDAVCRGWVEQWWDEACAHLSLPAAELADYRAALTERFANPRIRHLLRQIANDGSEKLPVRIAPVLRAERAAGRLPAGAVRALAGWLAHLRAGDVTDPRASELVAAAAGPDGPRAVVAAVAPDLADDRDLVAAVAELS